MERSQSDSKNSGHPSKKSKEIFDFFSRLKPSVRPPEGEEDTLHRIVRPSNRSRWPSLKQLSYLPRFLTTKEKRTITIVSWVIIIALLFWGVRLYLTHTHPVAVVGGHYIEGLIGVPSHINPILASSNDADMDISRLIFSSLIKYDKNRELTSDLARDWTISEDKKTYTFHLKDNLTWHDEEPLTASDVIFTIDAIQEPLYKSPLSATLRGVEAAAPDEKTVTITLKEPFAPFLNSLTFGILPQHLWADIPPASANLAEYNLKPVGSGPFKFNSLTKDRSGSIKTYTVERNAQYYDQPPYLSTITFKFYPDIESAIAAARSEKIEGISYAPKESKDQLAKNKSLAFYTLNLPQYTAVFFNQRNKLLADINVKQALAYAIDKQEIINKSLNQEGEVIWGPILPGFIGFNPELKKYEFDPGKAISILDQAGWKSEADNGNSLRKKGDQELRFTLTTIDQPEFVATANLLKEYWQKIGIGVELSIIDKSRIQKYVIKPRDYETLLFGEIVGSDPDPYPFWHSSQGIDPGLNLSVYVNKKVDQLLEEARKTDDLEQRRLKYLHFQNILADELPALFLYNPTYTYASSKKIKGFALERITNPSDRFIGIEGWYIKTKRKWGKE